MGQFAPHLGKLVHMTGLLGPHAQYSRIYKYIHFYDNGFVLAAKSFIWEIKCEQYSLKML